MDEEDLYDAAEKQVSHLKPRHRPIVAGAAASMIGVLGVQIVSVFAPLSQEQVSAAIFATALVTFVVVYAPLKLQWRSYRKEFERQHQRLVREAGHSDGQAVAKNGPDRPPGEPDRF